MIVGAENSAADGRGRSAGPQSRLRQEKTAPTQAKHPNLLTGQIPIKKLPKLAQRLDFLTLHAL